MSVVRRSLVSAVVVSLIAVGCSGGDSSPFGSGAPQGTTAPTAPGATALPSGGDDSGGTTPSPQDGGSATTTLPTSGEPSPTDTTVAVDTGSPRPLPLMEGLATFDTYEWSMSVITIGPTADEYVDLTVELAADRTADMRRTTLTTTQDGPDFDGPETSTQDTWQDSTGSCSFDGTEYTFEAVTAQQREIIDVALGLFDLQIIPEEGIEVGPETVAGVAATHYRYTISGLGRESGAVVTENQVDYWLADDTGALVQYTLVAETRSGPTTDPAAEVFRVEASAELRAANDPVDMTFPAECDALRPAPEEGRGAAGESGSRIVIRTGDERIGVLDALPACTFEAGTLSALVDGRIDETRYRVGVDLAGINAAGGYDGAVFSLNVAGGGEPEASGAAPVTVFFGEGGLMTVEFDATVAAGDADYRLRGSLTCST